MSCPFVPGQWRPPATASSRTAARTGLTPVEPTNAPNGRQGASVLLDVSSGPPTDQEQPSLAVLELPCRRCRRPACSFDVVVKATDERGPRTRSYRCRDSWVS